MKLTVLTTGKSEKEINDLMDDIKAKVKDITILYRDDYSYIGILGDYYAIRQSLDILEAKNFT